MGNEEVKIIPTIGRIVLVKCDSNYVDGNPEIFPAIITCVHNKEMINVAVFKHFTTEHLTSIHQGEEIGQWDWMPYQKGQAKKTEELESKLAEINQ